MKLDISSLWSPQNKQWLLIAACAFFLVLIVYDLGSLLFINKLSSTSITPQEYSPETPANLANEPISATLFGDYLPADLNESGIRASKLDVELTGILFSPNLNDSQVIIKAANGKEKNYHLGDTIPGGALIKRIMSEGVLLEYQGELERLSLPEKPLTFEPVARPLLEK